jgi:hypothetical protein
MGRVNHASIKAKIVSSPKVAAKALAIVEKRADSAKKEFLKALEDHPISQEIAAGNDSYNISDTLGGYGNLFTFLGFNEGEEPIADLIRFLDDNIKVLRAVKRRGDKFEFTVSMPSVDAINSRTKLEWIDGRGWAMMVEEGISGLPFYLFLLNRKSGRSGRGVQSTGATQGKGKFKNTRYLSALVKQLEKDIKSRNKII